MGGTSFELEVSLNEVGQVYYVVTKDVAGATLPSVDDVIKGKSWTAGADIMVASGIFEMDKANHAKNKAITDLSQVTSYKVHLAALDDHAPTRNRQYNVTSLTVTTTDSTTPEFKYDTPAVTDVTTSGFKLDVALNEKGKVYYALVADQAVLSSMSGAELRAQVVLNGSDPDVMVFGIEEVTEANMYLSYQVGVELTYGSRYSLYVVAEDSSVRHGINFHP